MKYVFLRFPDFRDKALSLSYDDGSVHDVRLIEIMSKYGLKGTFNLTSSFMEDKLPEQINLYLKSGNEVALHGEKHLALSEVAPVVATNEVIQGRLALEEMFDTIITGMAYPEGAYSDTTVEILKCCGVDYARTTVITEKFDIPTDWFRLPVTCHHKSEHLMELAHKFVEEKQPDYYWSRQPKLFLLFGHSHEFSNDNNWHIIEEFSEYVGNRDDIWYATNIEIFNYVKAFDALRFSANGKTVQNPSTIDVYINYYEKEYVIPAGQTVKLHLK